MTNLCIQRVDILFPATVSGHKSGGWNEAHVQMVTNSQSVWWYLHVYFITSAWNMRFSSSKHIRWTLDHMTGALAVGLMAARPPVTTSRAIPSLMSCFTAVRVMDDSRDEYSRVINVRLTEWRRELWPPLVQSLRFMRPFAESHT